MTRFNRLCGVRQYLDDSPQNYVAVFAAMCTGPDLRKKYDHLSYGEMAEVAELSQWAEGLRWAGIGLYYIIMLREGAGQPNQNDKCD